MAIKTKSDKVNETPSDMADETTSEKVAALLAQPDSAKHDAISELKATLEADISAYHDKWQTIGKNGDSWMGAERRRLMEAGDVDAVLRVDVEAERLKMQIAGAQTQSRALDVLDKQVFARESLANLPAQYNALIETLGDIADANKALSEGWARFEQQASEIELQRRAVAESREDVPAPPEALGEALTAGWRGAAPVPMSGAFSSLQRANIAEAIGLRVAKRWHEGVQWDAAA